jgi:Predicted membrane protein (DUF2078).
MGYYDGGWSAGEWLAMGAMMLLFWGLLTGLVVWAARNFRSGSPREDVPKETVVRSEEIPPDPPSEQGPTKLISR